MDYVVYSDMDGTILDDEYSFEDAMPGLMILRKRGIPLVLCSSKTRREMEAYRKRMGLDDPFISENGSAIYVPEETFNFSFIHDDRTGGYYVIGFGHHAGDVSRMVAEMREKHGMKFTSFSDMTVEDVAEDSGLPVHEALMAKEREYSEVALELGDEDANVFRDNGLNVLRGGRYYCICGSDKGNAVRRLNGLYRKVNPGVKTIGIGDSMNDREMLSAVDTPIIVQKPDGSYEDVMLDNMIKAEGVGPLGWSNAVRRLFR
ncbi:MAG: HAD-IIB family hydrolase [Candidatus Altiarchaeota archaeon]